MYTCGRINKDENNTIDLLSRKQRSRNGQTYDPIRKLEKEFNIPYNFFSPLRSSLRETIKINLQLFFPASVKYLDRSERNEKLSKEERREVNIEGDPVTFLSLSVPWGKMVSRTSIILIFRYSHRAGEVRHGLSFSFFYIYVYIYIYMRVYIRDDHLGYRETRNAIALIVCSLYAAGRSRVLSVASYGEIRFRGRSWPTLPLIIWSKVNAPRARTERQETMGHAAGRSHGDPAVFIRCTPLLSSFSLSTGLIFDFQRIFLSFFLCFEGERERDRRRSIFFFFFFPLGRKEERKEGMIFRGGLSNGSTKFLREHFSFLSFSSVFFSLFFFFFFL